jgi:CHAT domain-containing protein
VESPASKPASWKAVSQSSRPPAGASVSETELKTTAAQAGRGNGAADIYSYLRNAVWQNLPGTMAEVMSIGKMIPSATVVTGDKVSEENVKALSRRGELGGYRIIRFATHGLTVPDYSESSSILPGAVRLLREIAVKTTRITIPLVVLLFELALEKNT